MQTRKILVIDKDIDEKLGSVCNAALKNAGMDVCEDVNVLIYSIVEENLEEESGLFFDDDIE